MTINKWRDWIEFVALVAVVLSLTALVYELRQTQTAMRAQAYQARAFDGIAWNFELAKDEALRTMQERLQQPGFDPNELSPGEYSLAERLITIVRIDLDNEHYQFESGTLDPSFYYGETVNRIRVEGPVWRAMGIISPRTRFKAEVDRILAENQER